MLEKLATRYSVAGRINMFDITVSTIDLPGREECDILSVFIV